MTDRDLGFLVLGFAAASLSGAAAGMFVVMGLPFVAAAGFLGSVIVWTLFVDLVWKPEDKP